MGGGKCGLAPIVQAPDKSVRAVATSAGPVWVERQSDYLVGSQPPTRE
jgi:hypothetical protein